MESLMAGGGMPGGMPPPGAGAPPQPKDDGKNVDLTKTHMDKSDTYARNESSAFPMTNLFIGDTRLGCQSDADEQIIIHIAFTEFVKVHSVKFTEFNGGVNPEMNPTLVKIFVNRENIGFEDANDIDPTQELELTAKDLKEDGPPTLLKFVKFQRVKSLTFFIEDNAGAEVTALGALNIYGRLVGTTNMAEFKKQG